MSPPGRLPAGTQVTLWPAQGVVGHPYRAPLWRTAPGPGDCARTPLDDEIDEEPEATDEPEHFDDEED